MPKPDIDEVLLEVEEARRIAMDRLVELTRWIEKAREHASLPSSTLYELETDFQVGAPVFVLISNSSSPARGIPM